MKTSDSGIKFIERREQLSLVAYPDSNTPPVWTIGYGHTKDVNKGDTCPAIQAEQWLREDVASAELAVSSHVIVGLKQCEFDALVSLVFNIGSGNFASSTLLKLLNQSKLTEAAAEFTVWNRDSNGFSKGLLWRRTREMLMFLDHVPIL